MVPKDILKWGGLAAALYGIYRFAFGGVGGGNEYSLMDLISGADGESHNVMDIVKSYPKDVALEVGLVAGGMYLFLRK